jgi:hypothetical protein
MSRMSVGLAALWAVAVVGLVLGGGRPAAAAPDLRCYNKYKCDLIACKNHAIPPNAGVYNCYTKDGVLIPNCTCTLTDTTQYTICTYTTVAADNCIADAASIKRCDGTYTPPGGQPTFCANRLYECNPNATPQNPGGPLAVACAEVAVPPE